MSLPDNNSYTHNREVDSIGQNTLVTAPVVNSSHSSEGAAAQLNIKNKPVAGFRRNVLIDLQIESPRPLKASTLQKYAKVKALALANKENRGSEDNQSRDTVLECTPENKGILPKSDTRTFVFNGEEIILSAKHGSAVLDDVHKFLVAHYPLGAKEDNNDPAASKAELELIESLQNIKRQTHLSAPPVEYLSSPPVIEVLMRGLRSEQFNAQYNALWSAINITFQDGQTAVNGLVVAGVIPILNNLLLSGNDTIIANSAWLLSNIAGDGSHSKYQVVASGTILRLLELFEKCTTQQELVISKASWLLANLCRPSDEKHSKIILQQCMEITSCVKFLLKSPYNEVKVDAFWTLHYVTDPNNEKLIQQINSLGFIELAITLLYSEDIEDKYSILKFLGRVSSVHDEYYTNKMARQHVIRMKYAKFLLASQKGLAKTAMIILANLCLSGYDCIEAIICSNVMPVISQYADKFKRHTAETIELVWFLHNYCSMATKAQLAVFVQHNLDVVLEMTLRVFAARNDTSVIVGLLGSIRSLITSGFARSWRSFASTKLFQELYYYHDAEVSMLAKKMHQEIHY
ncbi:KPNA6 [Bugula neritina]|uniref:KPNA6 n=1 Tax=Bugula neritina TaxID=10212 RepID=A0A7J7KLU0_BUGNE|nr:KPNA6 [Bugula neritina]